MRTLAFLELAAVLILLAACVPPPPLPSAPPAAPPPTPPPTSVPTPAALPTVPAVAAVATPVTGTPYPTAQPDPAAAAVPANWQTYSDNQVGFSIRYPPGWQLEQMPGDAIMQGVAVDGPEGRVEMQWGSGWGGACPAMSATHLAQGQIPACHIVAQDGTQQWNGGSVPLPTPNTRFGPRGLTRDARPASGDLVLAVLATLTLGAPAALVPTPAPEPGLEILVDNPDASFWPKGNWYVLQRLYWHPQAQMYGEDCYQTLPGLSDAGEVRPALPPGAYEVFAWTCADPGATNLSKHGIVEVHRSANDAAPQAVGVNYQADIGAWRSLGTYNLLPSAYLSVKSVMDGGAIADGFRFVYRAPAAAETVPTPLPSGPIVTHNPPSPLQQLTSGDLAARLALDDPFYVSLPMTQTAQTFDDCQAFPREGCSGTREGWQAVVTHQAITLTYRVSSDYKLVSIADTSPINPFYLGGSLTEQQLVFLRVSGANYNYAIHFHPDSTWHVLHPGAGSTPPSDVLLPPDQAAPLLALADKYSTLYLQSADGGTLVFYGLGQTAAPTDADRETLLALGEALAGATAGQ